MGLPDGISCAGTVPSPATICYRHGNIIAGSGPSTRLVSAVSTICDGHQHICRKSLLNPVAIIYSKALTTDLLGKSLPCSTNIEYLSFL